MLLQEDYIALCVAVMICSTVNNCSTTVHNINYYCDQCCSVDKRSVLNICVHKHQSFLVARRQASIMTTVDVHNIITYYFISYNVHVQ